MNSRAIIISKTRRIDATDRYGYEMVLHTENIENSDLDGEVEVTIAKPVKNRSLNANAYFHVLVNKMADALSVSKTYMKNTLLGKYGQRSCDIESGVFFITVASEIDMMEREDIHTIAMGYRTINGKEYTDYQIITPSHLYSSGEMQTLIEGTIQDAKELGIETLPPRELEIMYRLWSRERRASL